MLSSRGAFLIVSKRSSGEDYEWEGDCAGPKMNRERGYRKGKQIGSQVLEQRDNEDSAYSERQFLEAHSQTKLARERLAFTCLRRSHCTDELQCPPYSQRADWVALFFVVCFLFSPPVVPSPIRLCCFCLFQQLLALLCGGPAFGICAWAVGPSRSQRAALRASAETGSAVYRSSERWRTATVFASEWRNEEAKHPRVSLRVSRFLGIACFTPGGINAVRRCARPPCVENGVSAYAMA